MYRRQIELIGEENQEKLSKTSVLIVGAGGLGNIIASTISCMGLKKIYIVDFDKIEIHNIHRQFQFSKDDIGRYKAEVLAKKLSRCQKLKYYVNKFDDDFIKKIENREVEIEKIDLIFDASDNFETRKNIDNFAKKLNIPWIYASVDEFRGQVGVFKKTSFEIFATKALASKGQIPPMVNLIGSISSMLGIKTLIKEQEEVLYYVDFENDLEIKKFRF